MLPSLVRRSFGVYRVLPSQYTRAEITHQMGVLRTIKPAGKTFDKLKYLKESDDYKLLKQTITYVFLQDGIMKMKGNQTETNFTED